MSKTILHTNTHSLKSFMFWLCLLGPVLAFAQPTNDECASAIELGVIPFCSTPAQYTSVGATASVIDPDPTLNTPSCFSETPTRDVWFSFVVPTDGSITDVHISLWGNINGNGTMKMPQVALYRGDCSVGGLAELLCAQAAVNINEVFLDALGLTPGLTYYLRINDYSATAGSNAGTFKLCVEKFIPSVNMGDALGANTCTGTLYDSGGPTGPYFQGENLTFDICPGDPHQCIYLTVENYNTDPGQDIIRILQGTAANPIGLISKLSGTGQNLAFQIPTDCVTISFQSDFFSQQDGFQIGWYCTTDACPDPTPLIEIPDNCNTAFNIANPSDYCSGVGEFENTDATLSNTPLPSCWGFSNNDVWFSFTALDEKAIINVNGSGNGPVFGGTMFAPFAALYGGTCTGLTELDCTNNQNFNGNTKMSFSNLTIGETYYVRVTGFGTGSFQLCITNNGITVPGDDCDNAISIPDPSDFCSDEASEDNTNAYNSSVPLPSCWATGSGDMWYSFTAVASKAFVTINGANFNSPNTMSNPQVAIYGGTCASLTELGCSNASNNGTASALANNLVVGQTYYIRVDGSTGGTFDYCIINTDQAAPGDECDDPILVLDPSDYCSDAEAVNTIFATASDVPVPSCWPPDTGTQDVWIQFTAVASTAVITVNGATFGVPGGTMTGPQIAVYGGMCPAGLAELACTSPFGAIGEVLVDELIPGQTYYIRVDGLTPGSFQYCIRNFFSEGLTSGDCPTAVVLCDKSSFNVIAVVGPGNDPTEMDNAACFAPFVNGIETTSTWYVWTCEQSGPLTFTLTPNNPDDDLDFIVYRLPNGPGDCSNKILERCMASGDFTGASPCMGPTGLELGDPDIAEDPGCQQPDDDAFLKELNMIAGRTYALVINNFTSTSNGFQMDLGGLGTIVGARAIIALQPQDTAACLNQPIIFSDSSMLSSGAITDWQWTFSTGGTLATANTQGPHTVTFTEPGTKIVTLTIETADGCTVSTTRTLTVAQCCALSADVITMPGCPGDLGAIGESVVDIGIPPYTYNWSNGGTNATTGGLQLGEQYLVVTDSTGCQDSIPFIVTELLYIDTIFSSASVDTIFPGDPVVLTGGLTVPGGIIRFINDKDTLLGPVTTVKPALTTTYIVQGATLDGCILTDTIVIFVKEPRVEFPNIFSPNNDGVNEVFYPVVEGSQILEMQIFNRWGKKVWTGLSVGWDGKIDGEPAPTDTYVYFCRYIRGVDPEKFVKGDVTLIR